MCECQCSSEGKTHLPSFVFKLWECFKDFQAILLLNMPLSNDAVQKLPKLHPVYEIPISTVTIC